MNVTKLRGSRDSTVRDLLNLKQSGSEAGWS